MIATPAQVRWLRSVVAADVTMTWPWGAHPPYYCEYGHRARDRGVLKKLADKRWIEIGERIAHGSRKIVITDEGRKALEEAKG